MCRGVFHREEAPRVLIASAEATFLTVALHKIKTQNQNIDTVRVEVLKAAQRRATPL
jgi:hypothetical protein